MSPVHPPIFSSTAPTACAAAASGAGATAAVVASERSPSALIGEMAATTPSATRQQSPITARSRSSSRVSANSVTPSTIAYAAWSNVSRMLTRTSGACWTMLASFAAVPSAPATIRPERTRLVTPVAM